MEYGKMNKGVDSEQIDRYNELKQKEVIECTYQSLHADLLLVFC